MAVKSHQVRTFNSWLVESSRLSYSQSITPDNNLLPLVEISTNLQPQIKGYILASIKIQGNGVIADLPNTEVKIKTRGNSTAHLPKKPYTLKFSKKQHIDPLSHTKKYVLLANYWDYTLLHNQVAMETAKLLGMTTANNIFPVNLVINSRYQGVYDLTEKVDASHHGLNLDKSEGILLHMESEAIGSHEFTTEKLGIRYLISGPNLKSRSNRLFNSVAEFRNYWKADIDFLEHQINAGNNIWELVDLDDFVNFMIINSIAASDEFQHPKSTYLHKRDFQDKWHFGPIWDYDYGFGINSVYNSSRMVKPSSDLFMEKDWSLDSNSAKFFMPLLKSEEFKARFREKWMDFVQNSLPKLLAWIDQRSDMMELAAHYNGRIWPTLYDRHKKEYKSSRNMKENTQELKTWIIDRADIITEIVER